MYEHVYECRLKIQFSNNNLDIGHAKSVVDFYSFTMNIKNYMENNFHHIQYTGHQDITIAYMYIPNVYPNAMYHFHAINMFNIICDETII